MQNQLIGKDLIKKGINISIVEGKTEAIEKNLLPNNFDDLNFEVVIESSKDMFDCGSLLFANRLNESLKQAICNVLPTATKLKDFGAVGTLVGNKKQFSSCLVQYHLQNEFVEQEISLHAIFRKH